MDNSDKRHPNSYNILDDDYGIFLLITRRSNCDLNATVDELNKNYGYDFNSVHASLERVINIRDYITQQQFVKYEDEYESELKAIYEAYYDSSKYDS